MKKIKPVIGWREWVELPQLRLPMIKAKVDTGARSSSLHAEDLEFLRVRKKDIVRFRVFPDQRQSKKSVITQAEVFEFRKVKSSNGQTSLRPVILTDIILMGQKWPIELTLANREEMGFRMLLGRETFRNRMLVDAGRSYYGLDFLKKRKLKVK